MTGTPRPHDDGFLPRAFTPNPELVQRLKKQMGPLRRGRDQREFPITPEQLRDKLNEIQCTPRDLGLEKKALVVTWDGPNKTGKSTASQHVGIALRNTGIEPVFFKESKYADPDIEAERFRFFRKYGLFGGNPLDRLEKVNAVRSSALCNEQFQEALADPTKVIFFHRSYLTTLAYNLFTALHLKNHDRRTLKRDRARFLCKVLDQMYGTFFPPDIALIYTCNAKTAEFRLASSGEMSGQFPPAKLFDAYDLITRALTHGDDEHPFGNPQGSEDLQIYGNNHVYRINTEPLSNGQAPEFYAQQNRKVTEIILHRFSDTLEERLC